MLASPQSQVSEQKLQRAAWISLIVATLLMSIKFTAYSLTGSKAVLSDAFESIVNVIGAVAALIVMRMVAEPADAEHPYGHGKLEYFSAVFEGGLITFASLLIIGEAVQAFFRQSLVRQVDQGIFFVSLSAVVNLILGFYLRRRGQNLRSEAILASAAHVLADVMTTAIVIVGLVLLAVTDLWWIDPVVAILMGLYLGFSGFLIVRRSVGGLIDEMDPRVVRELASSFEKHRFMGLIHIHQLKLIRSGRFHHIDAHLVMPRFWDVRRAHEAAEHYEKSVVADYAYEGEIAFHIDPCEGKYCRICDLKDCPVREHAFEARSSFATLELTKGPLFEHG